jgi:CRISPR-associated protein Cmr2
MPGPDSTYWTFKVHAYLHDPPDKPFALLAERREEHGGHAEWSAELVSKLTGRLPDAKWTELIARADHLAAGADRSALLPRVQPQLRMLRHPLSGQAIDLAQFGGIGPAARDRAKTVLDAETKQLAEETAAADPRHRFLMLWAALPQRLREHRGEPTDQDLGALWDWLPAETRMPNHPIALHQSLVSALGAVLYLESEPALLSFTIGPVQHFIAQARRTSDLWGGSALLSHALLAALQPIVDELGPDHVIFPALRRSRLFLQWLADKRGVVVSKGTSDSQYAGLPNRFLAVVPEAMGPELARRCEASVRSWWEERGARSARELEGMVPELEGFSRMAVDQTKAFLQVSWAVSPWSAVEVVRPGDEACQRVAWAAGGELPAEVARFVTIGHETSPGPRANAYRPNGGTLYSAAYDSAQRLLDATKRSRPIVARDEGGLKCSLCGERSVFPGAAEFDRQKAAWRSAWQRLGERGWLRRGEALCGVCWTKRRFGIEEVSVPSTAELAATPFKAAVLDRIDALAGEVDALVQAVALYPSWTNSFVVPSLRQQKSGGDERRKSFASVAGEALLRDPREDRSLDEEERADLRPVVRRIEGAAHVLRRAARAYGIAAPRPYLAVLVLDGDEMGKWLSGVHTLPLRQYLSNQALEHLRALDDPGVEAYLAEASKWPLTPALHATLSEACAVFSQSTAPRTLHDDGLPAFLVYSGGDDVLAFSAVGCSDPAREIEWATEAALRLRLRFSGHVARNGRGDKVDPGSPAGFVINREGLSLAFGSRATASAGLAVFHHRWPLGRALAEARRAEEYAKETLGRNALGLSILRRSGQVTRTGMKFLVPPDGGDDAVVPVRAFQRLAWAFAFDRLSPRFVTEIQRRFARIVAECRRGPISGGRGQPAGGRGVLSMEGALSLAQPIVLQAASDHFEREPRASSPMLRLTQQQVREAIEELARAAGDTAPDTSGTDDAAALARWLDLIEAAAFFGRGGEA